MHGFCAWCYNIQCVALCYQRSCALAFAVNCIHTLPDLTGLPVFAMASVLDVCSFTLFPFVFQLAYIAGDRVVADPLCKPFSMGRNLFCVHSRKRMDDIPELKSEKMVCEATYAKVLHQQSIFTTA